jgi:long-chain acyl-CoA synthetase
MSPHVSQVLVHGDKRNFVSALVTLDPEALKSWAGQHGLGSEALPDLTQRSEVRALVQKAVDDLNATLPRFATVKKFTVLREEFTEAAGEVTPSQKLKRKVIERRYQKALDDMYVRAGNGDEVA